MFKKTKGIILGVILGMILSGTVAVAAGNTTTLYDVINSGIRIVIDGKELHPTDANGKKVEPMIYNGTTYLPVRAVAGALGKAVYWDGPNWTVYLGDMDGELEYPTVMLTDMTSIDRTPRTTTKLTDNYGNHYGSAITNDHGSTGSGGPVTLEYLLNMKYSHFRATLYVPEGETCANESYITIKADGHILYTSPNMKKTSAPVQVDVDVSGYNDLIIEWSNNSAYGSISALETCLADAGFYQ